MLFTLRFCLEDAKEAKRSRAFVVLYLDRLIDVTH